MAQKKKKHTGAQKRAAIKASKLQETCLQIANAAKEEGNAAVAVKDFPNALTAYDKGLEACLECSKTIDDTNIRAIQNTLYSNRAFVYLKMENFYEAENDCNQVIATDRNIAKVWYRRALAREGKARNMHKIRTTTPSKGTANGVANGVVKMPESSSPTKENLGTNTRTEESPEDMAKDANDSEAMSIVTDDDASSRANLDEADDATREQEFLLAAERDLEECLTVLSGDDAQRQGMEKAIHSMTERIRKSLLESKQRLLGVPSPRQQQETVFLLLQNRQACLQQAVVMEGEAFFLVDWKWWCEWCNYVGVSNNKTLLSYLLPGACVPELDNTEDSSSDDEDGDRMLVPGPIDNSRLILQLPEKVTPDTQSRDVFALDWYQAYREDDVLTPNLVRGYHYELLPREVYAALTSWYGEIKPSLCRRVTPAKTIVLYPSETVDHTIAIPEDVTQCSACGTWRATSRCRRCMKAQYCNRLCQESHWPFHKMVCNAESPAPTFATGRVGLNNLGNTCFMNAALQSLSHATPLTRHFLSGRFKQDLNTSNPLGTAGKLAAAYNMALKELWWNTSSSISPTALRRAIALFAPRFAGCIQHDAQEFLAYLLDGLHEDLNRIRKAPYVEMPDVTDCLNMPVAGARAWDAHCRRNDSLVQDTFYGQFKSTCVCPQCNRVSVSFDAFNHVSLEIPLSKNAMTPLSILLFSAANPKPVRYGVEVRRNSPIVDLRNAVASLAGITPDRLALCAVFEHSVVDILKIGRPVSDISPDDFVVAYEVDAFNDWTLHVLVSHKLILDSTGSDDDGVVDSLEDEGKFGFPFMASFSIDLTCRQVWDFIWSRVSHMEDRRELLKIRLQTGRGKALAVFPRGLDGDTTEKSPFLPEQSDEKFSSFLGKDASEHFHFLSLEWHETASSTVDEIVLPAMRIREDQFLAYENHSSWIEVAQRAKAAAASKAAVSLDQCFEAFTKPERLDEHNKWYCSNCKEHVQAMKTMELWRLPNILIVHLKRFEFKNILRRDKLDTMVDFPLEGLDVQRHCASRGGTGDDGSAAVVDDRVPALYDLFAVTNHYGRMGSGHYTAFARPWDETSGLSPDWALFDDSSVHMVRHPKSTVVSPAAYVLFYRRRIFH